MIPEASTAPSPFLLEVKNLKKHFPIKKGFILTLMRQLQGDLDMAIMFITHHLGVIAQMADQVVVMYLGKVVEDASVEALFHKPLHPYTQVLLQSIPRLGLKRGRDYRLASISGSVPDPYNLPKGCPFHPRCTRFIAGRCNKVEPGHKVRCHLYGSF